MPDVADRLAGAGLVLPPAPQALGLYVPATRWGDLVMTAGQLPLRGGELITSGLVGEDVSLEVARECARQAALNALAAASSVCELDDVHLVLKVTGYVASSPAFTGQSKVVDGASEVMTAAFGETAGAHARAAIGVTVLPSGAPVEIEVVLVVGDL